VEGDEEFPTREIQREVERSSRAVQVQEHAASTYKNTSVHGNAGIGVVDAVYAAVVEASWGITLIETVIGEVGSVREHNIAGRYKRPSGGGRGTHDAPSTRQTLRECGIPSPWELMSYRKRGDGAWLKTTTISLAGIMIHLSQKVGRMRDRGKKKCQKTKTVKRGSQNWSGIKGCGLWLVLWVKDVSTNYIIRPRGA
jgi:hypothetical protein